MELDSQFPDSRESKTLGPQDPKTEVLRPRKTMVSIPALEAGIAGLLTLPDATEECLECQIDLNQDLLQSLGIDLF
jgi:hypothetical protein